MYGGDGDDLNAGNGLDYLDSGDGTDTLRAAAPRITSKPGVAMKGACRLGDDRVRISLLNGKDTTDRSTGNDRIEIHDIETNFNAKASNLVNTLADGSTIVNFENYDLYGEKRTTVS